MNYAEFIATKATKDVESGFDPSNLGDHLFDFQRAIVEWSCKRGRAAIFADTGLGKTAMQTEWARQVTEHTGGMVLIAAPLCVAQQTVEEASKFGIHIQLWSNPGDLVFSPFTGIGSEGYVSIEMGRRFVGAELKRSYWELAKRNLGEARERKETGLFADEELEAA